VKKNKESSQQSIFEYLQKIEMLRSAQHENTPPSGSLDIDTELRAAVSLDLKHAKDATGRELSRYEVAARMSELTGQEITKSQLDNWSAESHEKHRFPCQFLPAFVMATSGGSAFAVLSRKAGLFALPGPEALRAEIQRLDEEIKKIQAERQKRLIFLKEMEV
jgi:hypothetical protein